MSEWFRRTPDKRFTQVQSLLGLPNHCLRRLGVKHPPGLITLATSANLRAVPIKTLDFGSINGYNKQSQRCFGSPIGRGNRFKNGKVSVRVRPEAQQVCKDSTTEMKVSWYE